ncbi:MAG: hypothetical protein N4A37_13460 [Prolixibacteraceae bacterium]|nr:hypothetical protein [Prolixibacteraceae bacterium]
MVPPWFVHGLSIDFTLFDGGTMEKPWTNHGGTLYLTYRIHYRHTTKTYNNQFKI